MSTNQTKSSKFDIFIKLSLIFFISLLSFAVGTWVGKRYTEQQHKLAQLEPKKGHGEEGHRSTASAEEGEHHAASADEHITSEKSISDEEIAKLAEQFVTNEEGEDAEHGKKEERSPASENSVKEDKKSATSKKEETHADKKEVVRGETKDESHANKKDIKHGGTKEDSAHSDKKTDDHGLKDVKKSAAHDVKDEKITAAAKEVSKTNAGKFTVQVSAYATQKDADTKVKELKEKGYSAFVVTANVNSQNWYRVNVGLFTTQKEAAEMKANLMAKSAVESAIIQKISE